MSRPKVLKWRLQGIRNRMPVGKIVAVGFQQGRPHVWVETLPGEKGEMSIETVMTGGEVPENGTHVGTAVSDEFVVHVYRVS